MGSEALQSYMEMLKQTRCLVVMGTKGTCKTSLASGLAKHLAQYVNELEEDEEMIGGGVTSVVNFNVDKDGIDVSGGGREVEGEGWRGEGERFSIV